MKPNRAAASVATPTTPTGTHRSAAPSTNAAIYKQIERELRERIEGGVWPAGAMLPSRRELARQFAVSPLTVERAVGRLVDEGLLRSDDRRGTFVTGVEKEIMPAAAEDVLGLAASAGETKSVKKRSVSRDKTSGPRRSSSAAVDSVTIGVLAPLYSPRQEKPRNEYAALNDFWVRLLIHSLEERFDEPGESVRVFNLTSTAITASGPATAGAEGRRFIAEVVNAAVTDGGGVDAVVLIGIGMPHAALHPALDLLEERGIPVVCVWSGRLSRPVPNVYLDNQSSGYQAAEYLAGLGCRDILLFAPFRAGWQKSRWEGARDAFDAAKRRRERAGGGEAGGLLPAVSFFPETVEEWNAGLRASEIAYEAAGEALRQGLRPDGILCVNDEVAFGWMRAAAEHGLTAGVDYRILGFDDHPESRECHLTTLQPPGAAMARETARLLRKSLRGRDDSLQIGLHSRLIVRASTASLSPSEPPVIGDSPETPSSVSAATSSREGAS